MTSQTRRAFINQSKVEVQFDYVFVLTVLNIVLLLESLKGNYRMNCHLTFLFLFNSFN